MPEFLTNFSNQITEYWNKFTRTQKIQIIALFVVGLIALVVLTIILSRPNYEVYKRDISPEEMNTIKTALDEANIGYEINQDASSISVEEANFKQVKLLLAEKGILGSGKIRYGDYFDNIDMTMGTSDKQIMAQLAFEADLEEIIVAINAVDEASVKVVLPDDDNFVFQQDNVASATVWLDLNSQLNDDQIFGIAATLEGAVDGLTTDNIKIFDNKNSKLLYNGSSSSGTFGILNSYLEAEIAQEGNYVRSLEKLLLNSTGFDDAVVNVNLSIDFDEVATSKVEYDLPVGRTESLPTRVYIMTQSGTNTEAGGVPGTDSNADTTTYQIDTGMNSESSTEVRETDYAVNEIRTDHIRAVGSIVPEESTVSIVLNRFTNYREALLESQGAFETITWEQYQDDNRASTTIDVDPELKKLVANMANLSEDKVVIMAYEVPRFIDKPIQDNQVADYIPVIIIVLMIGLLGYAVYKGTEPVEVTEVEPELSVEDMLATTSKVSEELESIEFDDKSEARVQIEKFVDENPEAVAQLLRNWLNEDWE